jgi:hypothetical protein
MSKTPEIAGTKPAFAAKAASARQGKSASARRAEVGPAMAGCDILVQALEREGVEVIFAYPGGASMEIHQSLTRSKIRTILPRRSLAPAGDWIHSAQSANSATRPRNFPAVFFAIR